MKELSIEEKAKRYDEALERAKGAHNSAKSDKENGVTDKITEYTIQLAETIFPELKVSDDERIRKSLIELFHDTVSNDEIFSDYGLDKTEVLAWLEKQGNNANKVKSIFEVGKWIVANVSKYTFLLKRGAPRFQAEGTNGDIYSFYLLPNGEKEYHLWSIEDAKDGDVLVASDKSIFIYDGSINENGFAVDKIISSDTTFTPTDISVKINQGVPVYEDSTFTLAVTDVKPTLYSNYILPVRYEPDSDADLTVLYDRMIGRFRSGKAGPQIVHVNVCGYSKAVTINVLPFKEDTDGGETGGETGGGSGSGGSNSGGSNSGGSNSGGSNSGGSSSGGSSGRGTVVSPKPLYIHVANIAITGISKKIAAGKKIQLTAIIAPENATNRGVIWSTSNPKIATVTAGGLVKVKNKTGKKSVVITATAADGSGKKADFKITSMKNPVKKVKISGKKTVKAGKSIKLKAKVTAKSGANKKLLWTSSNTAYAVVNSKGKIKTLKAGKGKTGSQ